jgi:hypothetical protein
VFHYLSASVKTVTGYEPEEFLRHYTTYMTDNPINARVRFTEEAAHRQNLAPYLVEAVIGRAAPSCWRSANNRTCKWPGCRIGHRPGCRTIHGDQATWMTMKLEKLSV